MILKMKSVKSMNLRKIYEIYYSPKRSITMKSVKSDVPGHPAIDIYI